ncbi:MULTISPECIES: methyltransferase domain-containing protein [Archaeoglobus]|uniref:Probable cobalt-precorrin-6B C(15)-methyltransferase (decarboxylating) n=3 Tax=Archaeoglobus fulgidus TaxID=2234 RepID=CBIT_ARCFU|nr:MULTISPECIES: methyltransferase domain-containing protein [Archaeoglobus]O29526.1 RecName: Full=Probable cobalt-precorrin-6B C(15)-methyltransferase (decarboxylating) [Archaeoglobus fulgidus DSM 4304]AAB90506.1 cobalamin biosynthesis precorrin-8W decarboxylase (cbiT) [Archaeoglobus fulgidus DSM 4304]AIG97607.1 Precorrin-6B methylase 2 [Archaeoglobus fulgidus DSM 8774]KUJ93502.1 MAG: cobalt-precorrin-6Y C(15)-methyltransferase [Archaeoglobus fulgidus]KUK07101.1 MAG: putative cobalt-precorrin
MTGKFTKEEVIGVVFSKLRPSPNDVFADIGCGSGAVTEFFAPYVRKAYAIDIEISDEARERLKRFDNVVLLEMDGKEFLKKYSPDVVFIGGTKGVEEMLEICNARRVVVNAARIEVALSAARKMREKGIFREIVLVNAAKSYELAGGLAFRSLNPVFVVFGER